MTVLVVIDMQQEFSRRIAAGWDCCDPAAIGVAAGVLARFRAAAGRIVHVYHDDPRPQSGFRLDKPTGAVMTEVAPRPGEAVVVKHTSSAFAAPGLVPALAGERELVIVGAALNYCVNSTIRSAVDLGYAVTLVSDASFNFGATAPSGRKIDAATVRDVTLAGLGDFARIVPAAALSM